MTTELEAAEEADNQPEMPGMVRITVWSGENEAIDTQYGPTKFLRWLGMERDRFERSGIPTEMLRSSVEGVRLTMEALGVSLGLVGIVAWARGVNEAAVSTVRLSEQAHISTEAFQALSYAAISAGLNQGELASKLEFLNKSMGLAAEGSSKQNAAIADLGLNTAELLALPVEDQLAAIAKGYVNASDKGKAWADVIVLLGRGAATMQQVLTQLGTNGVPAQQWWMPSDKELQTIRERNEGMEKFWTISKGLAASAYANLGSANGNAMGFGVQMMQDQSMRAAAAKATASNPIQLAPGGMSNKPGDLDNPIQSASPDPADVIAKQMADTLAALPAMQAAHRELMQALQAEAGGYETLDEKAARLREYAAADEAAANKMAGNPADFAAQVEAVKLQTQASKERAEATKDEAETDQKYIKETIKDANADYEAEKKRGEIHIQNLEREEAARLKLNQVAMAAIDHDYTLTDNQKWEDKRAIIQANITGLQSYIDKQNAIANSPLLPTEVSQKAKGDASTAQNSLAASQGQLAGMGPDPQSFYQNFSADLTKLQTQWSGLQQNMASGLTGVINTSMQSVESNISKLIMGTETWRKALMNIVTTIESSVVSSFIQMGVKWVATQIMMAVEGKATAAASAAGMIPIAMAESEIWAAPAALATIASWGGAAMAAPELVLASMAATQALAGFAAGGYTGGTEGDFAGVVHGGEYVFSAPAVRNIGADNLDRAHTMAKSGGAGGNSGPAPSSGMSHSMHFHQDENAAFRAALRHPSNFKTIVDMTKRSMRQI
jgi:hypothetical protein